MKNFDTVRQTDCGTDGRIAAGSGEEEAKRHDTEIDTVDRTTDVINVQMKIKKKR